MNKHFLAALLLCLATAVSAQTRSAPRPVIDVEVVDGQLRLSQDMLRSSAYDTVFVWRLRTPGYRFAPNGVAISNGGGRFSCETINDGQGARCTKNGHEAGASYRYAITLLDLRQTNPAAMQLPQPEIWIQND